MSGAHRDLHVLTHSCPTRRSSDLKDTVDRLRPLFETLAPAKDRGWGHVGPVGAGHFNKMVHNGIEYGMMQARSEEQTSELQSLMRISYAVLCLKKKR